MRWKIGDRVDVTIVSGLTPGRISRIIGSRCYVELNEYDGVYSGMWSGPLYSLISPDDEYQLAVNTLGEEYFA